MASSTSALVSTGRSGTIVMRPMGGPPNCIAYQHVEINSQHVAISERTLMRENFATDIPMDIKDMDDGGPVPFLTDFHMETYTGTQEYRTGFPPLTWFGGAVMLQQQREREERQRMVQVQQQHNALVQHHGMQPYQPSMQMPTLGAQQSWNVRVQQMPLQSPQTGYRQIQHFLPQRPAASMQGQTVPPPVYNGISVALSQPQTAQIQGQTVQDPIVIHDEEILAKESAGPIITQGEQVQIEESSPPSPPCHLRERLRHVQHCYTRGFDGTALSCRNWLRRMRMAPYKQQQEYCRLFWSSNEDAEKDIMYAATHFIDFFSAYTERRFVEAKKAGEEPLLWEEEGPAIEAKWRVIVAQSTAAAKLKNEMREEEKRREQAARRREARTSQQTQRDGERCRERKEAAEKRLEEKAQEKARKVAERAAERARNQAEKEVEKAEKVAKAQNAASSRKRKATPEPEESSKKSRSGEQEEAVLPTEAISEAELIAGIEAEFDEQSDLPQAAPEVRPSFRPRFTASQTELINRIEREPGERLEREEREKARKAEWEADRARQYEEAEKKKEKVVLSPLEEINAEIEKWKRKLDTASNMLFKRRINERMNDLRVQREMLL